MSLTKTKPKALTNLLTIAFALFCMTVLFKVNAHASTFTMTDVSIYDGSNITDTKVYESENIANGQTVDVTGISNTTSFPRSFKFEYDFAEEEKPDATAIVVTAKLGNNDADSSKWSCSTDYAIADERYFTNIIVQAAGTWEFKFTIGGFDLGTFIFVVNEIPTMSAVTVADSNASTANKQAPVQINNLNQIDSSTTTDITIDTNYCIPRKVLFGYTLSDYIEAQNIVVEAKLGENITTDGFTSATTCREAGYKKYQTEVSFSTPGVWTLTFKVHDSSENKDYPLGTFRLTIPADTVAPTIDTYKALLDSSTVLIDAHVSDAASKVAEVKLVDKVTYDAATGETSKEKYEYINSSNSGKLVSANNENEFSTTTEEGGTLKKVYAGISEFKVTQNGNYYVFAKDFSGNVGVKLVEVNEIPTTQGGITIGSIKYEDIVSGSVVTGQKVTIPITTKLSNYGLVSIYDYQVAISEFNRNSFSNGDYDYHVEYRDEFANLVTYHGPWNKIYTKTCGDFILSSSRKIDYDSSSIVDNANGKYTLVYNFDGNENYYFIATDDYGNQIIRNINVEHVGDQYNRPSSDSSSSSGDDSGSSTTTTVTETKEAAPITVTYTVKKGDTLSKIARKNGLTLNELIALNPQIKNPNLIYIGQAITVSKTSATTNAATTNTTANKTYTIVKGDTLFKIARRNGLTLAELKSLNESLFAQKYIFAGQTVLLK